MTAEQAATLKRLAEAAYELDAFKPNLTRAEADVRVFIAIARRTVSYTRGGCRVEAAFAASASWNDEDINLGMCSWPPRNN